jgi:hypothetical protein
LLYALACSTDGREKKSILANLAAAGISEDELEAFALQSQRYEEECAKYVLQ